jgi:hypothetical protein
VTAPDVAELDAAWLDYASRMRAAGERITGEGFPTDGRMRAEGYRFVKRLENLAHQIYVEFPSTRHPMLFRYGDDITPFGATNTDNNYYRAMVDPAFSYRITADVSGVKELLIAVQDGEFVFGKVADLAHASLGDLTIGDDGWLDLYLGGPARPANWLPLPPEATYVNLREFVGDWERDGLAVLNIERLDDVGPPEPLSPATMVAALDRAASWVEASIETWHKFAAGSKLMTPVNDLAPPGRPTGGAADMLHGATQWSLARDEALLVEFDQPQVTYWSIQTYVLEWLQPLDFVNRVTSLNDGQLAVDDDDKVRIVLSHRDPGMQNWLDTSGLTTGFMSYRYVKPTTAPVPTTALVDVDAVRDHVPASTPVFSPKDRREQIAARRRGVARRFRR